MANIYFPQAISPLIASDLHVSTDSAALVATAAQLGYAGGVFLLVPLGDRLANRPLILTLLTLTGLGLLAASFAPTLAVLTVASVAVGLTTIVPQIIIPMTVGLVDPRRRGAVTGTLLGGLLGGILLARAFGGTVGEWLGWRAPYMIAAGLALLLAVLLAFVVPRTTPSSKQSYPALLGASVKLFWAERDLRRSGLYQATLFGGFSAAWTSLSLLISGPTYNLTARTVGLLALVGAASVFITPIAGRWIDRRGSDPMNLMCIVAAVAAAGILAFGVIGGVVGLVVLAFGLLLLDTAVQSGQVANQARIFALRPDARSRVNTAYMTCSFVGGTVGSWLGVHAYTALGWLGVSGLVAFAACVALGRHLLRGPVDSPTAGERPALSEAGN
ncbi:putative MFS family arabinose efflux permease [Actinocrispum wychmicini]|uniref:Putative MFS family arabinose efflux permease n=1 Tax=Actinocrispum wychmicini TaxID=1213861 RepID=A0A4V6NNX0_9PSEU|nr:putative MFS family arabinose efflux permease [Actinocrispum wychmicini]